MFICTTDNITYWICTVGNCTKNQLTVVKKNLGSIRGTMCYIKYYPSLVLVHPRAVYSEFVIVLAFDSCGTGNLSAE